MNAGLLGLGLIYWGWRADALPLALPLALLIELPRLINQRWRFTDAEFCRLVDLSSLAFLGATVYFFARHGSQGIYLIATWLPVILYPLILVQRFSESGRLKLLHLILSLRKPRPENRDLRQRQVDVGVLYLAVCLVAATVASPHSPWHVPLLLGFTAGALLPYRPSRYPLAVWLGVLVLVGLLGFAGQLGLKAAQAQVEELVLSWFQDHIWSQRDPYTAYTAIGQIGSLKMSDRILFRVEADHLPPLLRQASYQRYQSGNWRALDDQFQPLPHSGDLGTWQFATAGDAARTVTVSGPIQRGTNVLPLPGGTHRFGKVLAGSASANPLGTVKVSDTPGFVSYRALYLEEATPRDAPPTPHDRRLPDYYRELFSGLVGNLGLRGGTPDQVLAKLEDYFRDFRYSLVQPATLSALQPLRHFLNTRKQGHCEYFATASTLLLRAAGIPARYATGYAVQEYSPVEDAYLVRRRHAHSWSLAWIDGRWRDVDFTPAEWAELEQAEAPWWSPMRDLFSWLSFQFDAWRWRESEEDNANTRLYWLLLPLAALLVWRLHRQQRARVGCGGGGSKPSSTAFTRQGTPFDEVVRNIEQQHGERRRGETLKAWLWRLRLLPDDPELEAMLMRHYELRFDPGGTDTEDGREVQPHRGRNGGLARIDSTR